MANSPLTQQNQPQTVFEPKIVSLYGRLFQDTTDDDAQDEGFWREFFLLKQDLPRLHQNLDELDASFLLHHQHIPQQFLINAIAAALAGQSPADEHALDALTVFFAVVLSKKYTNPSADIIDVLAGLDHIDSVFNDLVSVLDRTIKEGRDTVIQQKAVRTAISLISGGYQTALVSYFINRDLFPALMKLVLDVDDPLEAYEPLLLTGLLANYQKFESPNQYRVRLTDFFHETTMSKAIESFGWTSVLLRDHYIAISDDTPTGWSLSGTLTGTLTFVGLGGLTGAKTAAPVLTEDQQRELFAEQPGHQAASLLSLYDFTLTNTLFRRRFVSQLPADVAVAPPFANFLSFTSYLYQHAYRNPRSELYSHLTLLIVLLLIEDPLAAKLLCDTATTARLCRQRPPFLPLVQNERPYASTLIDILTDGLSHNLRKRLDTTFLTGIMTVLSRLLSHLAKTNTKLQHHWSELWRSLLSFVRFLTTYADDLKTLPGTYDLIQALISVLVLSMAAGESFLPNNASYDDLFYKLVESGEALTSLREKYALGKVNDEHSSIGILIGVSRHYNELIESQHKGKSVHLTPREVSKIIKDGYDTLSIEAREDLDHIEAFREAQYKVALKKIARIAVADASFLVTVV
ncbi:DUF1741-domain-containing protein [Polychaeton citri CBS 116435]|uniref:DUF1741-domain-containing protein n=1 Tax=Polychaeton citri CBS 116435 TaxID=1314669 RepID=A0A9P4UJY1_9PEZI|nr:DUF1741-domain-containing protein [Polychaeton citri CBS 116435]